MYFSFSTFVAFTINPKTYCPPSVSVIYSVIFSEFLTRYFYSSSFDSKYRCKSVFAKKLEPLINSAVGSNNLLKLNTLLFFHVMVQIIDYSIVHTMIKKNLIQF